MAYRLGVDVGGTFTDFILADDSGGITEAKVPSGTDPSVFIREGLERLAEARGSTARGLVRQIDQIVHGTTVALNALLQSKGDRTGLICTDGFRDTLEVRQGYKEKRYDFTYYPPPPLVPRYLRVPVRERIDKNGNVFIPLVEEDVQKAIDLFRRYEVRGVAVCLLWSFLQPVHETRIGDILREGLPDVYISLSSEVSREIGEYARVSTTVINAYIGRIVREYTNNLEKVLRETGYEGSVRYIQSNGGLAAGEVVKTRPVLTLNSGPAAGPPAGVFLGNLCGYDDVITVDMGGTSFDSCLISRRTPHMTTETDIGGYRVTVPMVDVKSIGAGGGTVAWVDRGLLRVGPGSAEADPGPACYGRGGTQATVTDADVVLGYLNPSDLLGGRLKIDAALASQAVRENIAAPLNLDMGQAAFGVFELVNRNMADSIRSISIEKGHDPRDFALVVGGGAGPVHAGRVAEALDVRTLIIPKVASVFCAFGSLVSEVRHDSRRSYISLLQDVDWGRLRTIVHEMVTEQSSELHREGIPTDHATVTRALELRYKHQVHAIAVDVSDLPLADSDVTEIERRFHQAHQDLYDYSQPDYTCELVNAWVTARGRLQSVQLKELAEGEANPSTALKGKRPMLFAGDDRYVAVPVYDGERLQANAIVDGPAAVEEPHTTLMVFPGWRLQLRRDGVYIMTQDQLNASPKEQASGATGEHMQGE